MREVLPFSSTAMPTVQSTFRAPFFLRNGHVQTILPVLLPRRIRAEFVRQRLELPDGDFLDLDWLRRGAKRLAILAHGLEGNSTLQYIRGMAAALARSGWDALAYNFRGCSGEPNRLPRAYHSGETGDLRAVIARAAKDYPALALIGFSLGGNVILKYLGEAAPQASIRAAAAICAPIDLGACARKLDQRRSNRIYLRRFIVSLIDKIEAKATLFPDVVDATGARHLRNFQQFDDRYTGPLHGFRDADDYWSQSSARQFLPHINVPTLLLQPRNDPFLAPEAYPWPEAEANPHLYLEAPDSGGHVGFLDLRHGLQPWSERHVAEFLNAHA
jgi:predicted alpha/beta-fold hydrolase